MARIWLAGAPVVVLWGLASAFTPTGRGEPGEARPPDGARNTCLTCHSGIEEMHPWFALSCTDCHGGDDHKTRKDQAHVLPRLPVPTDERVLGQFYDLPYRRFLNPANLRVAKEACGDCHGDLVAHLQKSLHGTTAGHLGDGFYEHGLTRSKRPTYSIFPVRDTDGVVPEHAIAQTTQVPGFRKSGPKDRIETHYSDLPRKACMQCHLYSEGIAVDGRVGHDGDYRGEGCAACHVTYAEDGRSRSADSSIDKLEPGHPMHHRLTSKIPTATCTRCHYGDASIGLHFRGLAQLVPGMPAGPEVPGTTDKLKNRTFYIKDPSMTPPDIHHQRGMHCIDCHTLDDVMGDGNIYPQMDFAVEIECVDCHGTFDRVSNLMTSHGRRITNLDRVGDRFFLTSKVTGKRHEVVQAKYILDPGRKEYDRHAAAAMTPAHRRLECYACHSGWNVDFFGFHFDRNEQFAQLDLLSGKRTPGRVTTQEKVFATFNQLRLGFNHEGKIAPYMVGFSTIGSAHDERGEMVLRQATPETAAGLSGVTMIPHQMHSVRPEARTCVECHRSPATYGLGSVNFRLTREYGYAITAKSLVTIAINAVEPARTAPVASVDLPAAPRALGVRQDPIHARATHAYVGAEDGSLTVVSLRNPVMPRVLGSKTSLLDPRRMIVKGRHLYVADGVGGIAIFDLQNPARPKPVGTLPTIDARSLFLDFPWLLVADGAGGLLIADVADPTRPRILSSLDLNGEQSSANEARDVTVLFQYSKTHALPGQDDLRRSRARHLAFVACGLDGVRIVDFTEPARPRMLLGRAARRAFRFGRGDVLGVAVNTVFDIGSAGGGIKSGENDYLYVWVEQGADRNRQQRVYVFNVSDPLRPQRSRGNARVYGGSGKLLVVRTYNAPFLQHFVLAAGSRGVGTLIDVSKIPTNGPRVAASWEGLNGLRDLVLEEFAFDRLQDEEGTWIKDISHQGCRYLNRGEVLKVLRAQLPAGARPRRGKGTVMRRQFRGRRQER